MPECIQQLSLDYEALDHSCGILSVEINECHWEHQWRKVKFYFKTKCLKCNGAIFERLQLVCLNQLCVAFVYV